MREDHVLEDSFKCIMDIKDGEQLKHSLRVVLKSSEDNNDCDNSMTKLY